jgi:hypothetical protein
MRVIFMCKVIEVKGEIFTDPEDLLFTIKTDKTINRELVKRFRNIIYEPEEHPNGTPIMYLLDRENMKITIITLQTNTPKEGTHKINIIEV